MLILLVPNLLQKARYFSYVCSSCARSVLSVSSSSWCLGRAAVCDCGIAWTFHLPYFWNGQ